MAMELPLAVVLNENAPIDPTAQRLLNNAQLEAGRRGQPVDVVHVMMAIVHDPWPIHEVHDSPAIRMLLTDGRAMNELTGALRIQMNALSPSPQRSQPSGPLHGVPMPSQTCTGTLRRCMGLARGRWPSLPLDDTMLVWATLNDNNDARDAVVSILDELPDTSFEAILSDLERRVRRDALYHDSISNPAIDHSHWMPDQLAARRTFQHVVRHRDLMVNIANALQTRGQRSIVLVSGQNGSPLHHVSQILADAIGDGTIRIPEIQSVWCADVANYLKWAEPPVIIGAESLLQEGIDYVKAQHGVLVLEHLESLKETTQLLQMPLQRQLFGQLWSVAGAAIVALYEIKDGEQSYAVLQELGLSDDEAELVPIDPYNVEYALHSLHTNFVPAWEERGFIFAGDPSSVTGGPYQDLLALRGGAKVHGKFMALPYFLIDVTEYLFARRDEPEAIRGWALTAEQRVNALLAEKASARAANVLQFYKPLLNEALQQVRPLVARPELERRETQVVVTRGHLTAAFLGSALSRFNYPDTLPS